MPTKLQTSAERLIARDIPPTHPPMSDAIADDAILIRPGNLARATKTVGASEAVESLREVHKQEQEHARTVAEAEAKLRTAREKAILIQEELEARRSQVAEYQRAIARAESGEAQYKGEMAEAEAKLQSKLGSDQWDFAGLFQDWSYRQFVTSRIAEFLKRNRELLATAQAELKAFEAQHLQP
jgi:chromosome segregation ATPase